MVVVVVGGDDDDDDDDDEDEDYKIKAVFRLHLSTAAACVANTPTCCSTGTPTFIPSSITTKYQFYFLYSLCLSLGLPSRIVFEIHADSAKVLVPLRYYRVSVANLLTL